MCLLKTRRIAFVFVMLLSAATLTAADRDLEIQAEMWNSSDQNFNATATPEKWTGKSAVIIAQLNRFEYRKPVMLNQLRYNAYHHYRIKLLDNNAVNKYAEISYYPTHVDSYTGENIKVYVGFKVIKPNGKEIIIDPSTAVTMQQEMGSKKQSYNKIAIPNLEAGDIIDYYICTETSKTNHSLIYFFDPVIHSLPQEYPVLYYKLQFRAQRRCFINLRSLNGAPELKLMVDERNDEKYYTLEGADMEGVEGQRWLYTYRELPSIKFRAAFASGKAIRAFDVLLGKPGELKSSVTKREVEEMATTMMAVKYDVKFLTKNARKKLKGVKDPFKIADETYYFYRNELLAESEAATIQGQSLPACKQVKFADAFSTFLAKKKIPHDIVIAIPRNISSLDDLLMEHEIEWLVRVKKGNEYRYYQAFDINTEPGVIPVLLEGTEAYALDGMSSYTKSGAKRITLPGTTANDNSTHVVADVNLSSLDKASVKVTKTLAGRNKIHEQYALMDVYDFKEEEQQKFTTSQNMKWIMDKKKFEALKKAYESKRGERRKEYMKASLERDYDLKVSEVGDISIEKTGRYNHEPVVYSAQFETEDLVKKVGPNYMVDVGKLIEQQTKIDKDELDRRNNVYFDNARSFHYKIVLTVPAGYRVQGLDKLNHRVENSVGGFTSTAKEEGGKIVIETHKHYDTNYVPVAKWNDLVSFINAAYSFTEQKILLKKSK